MRKNLLNLLGAAFLGLCSFSANAQLADYSIAPNWTFNDLQGNTHTLYDYLDAGKTVVIDVSAAWCAPCWAYHNSGSLEDFHNTYGPTGTDQAMVFFIEGELQNSTSQLYYKGVYQITVTGGGSGYTTAPTVNFAGGGGSGAMALAVLTGDAVTSIMLVNSGDNYTSAPTISFTGGGGSGAAATCTIGTSGSSPSNSQGCWTNNTPYPILDLATATPGASTFMSGYDIGYFPTIYIICPNRVIREAGQVTTADLNTLMGECPAPGGTVTTDGALIAYTGQNYTYDCTDLTFPIILQNNGSGPLSNVTITAYNGATPIGTGTYTGTLANLYDIATVNITATANITAPPTLSFEITAGDGASGITTNNDIDAAMFFLAKQNAPVTETFASATFPPTNWLTGGWSRFSGSTITGHDGNASNAAAYAFFYNWSAGTVGYLYTPEINLSAATGSVALKFWMAHALYNGNENDKLEVVVSTDCGQTWTPVFNKSGTTLATHAPVGANTQYIPAAAADWREEYVNLSAYAGMDNVFIAFKATSGFGNILWVDDVNVNSNTGVEKLSLSGSSLSVYPNPATDLITVSLNLGVSQEVSLEITNIMGQVVMSKNFGGMQEGNHALPMDVTTLAAGNYFVNVRSENGILTHKFTK